ncbi:hypothetical protein [Shewanella glacialipiscicola]|uniref:hypothetical protein n=1 Tax=Shewanella glacialipiscicola TaxID=614069 RepID=UPI003D7968C2
MSYPIQVRLMSRSPYGAEELHGKIVPARWIKSANRSVRRSPSIEVKGEFLSTESHQFSPDHHYSFFIWEVSVVSE